MRQADPMRIKLSDERKDVLLSQLVAFYRDEFDEDLSGFRAEQLLTFFVRKLGPQVYNQAIQDARAFMLLKLEDLDAEFHEEDPDVR
ncbi:MAG: DUF2164 domain-containing protein [Opitutaceae bacterium]